MQSRTVFRDCTMAPQPPDAPGGSIPLPRAARGERRAACGNIFCTFRLMNPQRRIQSVRPLNVPKA